MGYLCRRPDPSDGRAKLNEFTERGWDSVEVTALVSFAAIETELADDIGAGRMRELRRALLDLVATTAP